MEILNKQEIQEKLDLVIEKLMHLDGPDNEEDLKTAVKPLDFSAATLESQNGTGRRESDCMVF